MNRVSPSAGATQLVVGLLRRGGEVLLCHRHPDRAIYPDVWDLPGGHVDTNESLGEALVRELEEELGIRIDRPTGQPWTTLRKATIELHVFLVDRWEGEPHNVAPEEHDEIRWFEVGDLNELAVADDSYMKLLRKAIAVGGSTCRGAE